MSAIVVVSVYATCSRRSGIVKDEDNCFRRLRPCSRSNSSHQCSHIVLLEVNWAFKAFELDMLIVVRRGNKLSNVGGPC